MLASCPPKEGCKHLSGRWEGRSVSFSLPLPVPSSPYFIVQTSGNFFGLLLNILRAQLGHASLCDKFLLSSKCEPQPVNEKSHVKARCISNWMLFLKKQILDRVGGDDVHSWQSEGKKKKSVDREQAKKRKGSEEENVSRMRKDRATRVSKLKKYYLMIMKGWRWRWWAFLSSWEVRGKLKCVQGPRSPQPFLSRSVRNPTISLSAQ